MREYKRQPQEKAMGITMIMGRKCTVGGIGVYIQDGGEIHVDPHTGAGTDGLARRGGKLNKK